MLKLCKELEKVEISRIQKFIISYFPLLFQMNHMECQQLMPQ